MAYEAFSETELGEGNLHPSAPPRLSQRSSLRSRSGSPPRYDAVLANDPQAREMASQVRGRGFQESLAHAGKDLSEIAENLQVADFSFLQVHQLVDFLGSMIMSSVVGTEPGLFLQTAEPSPTILDSPRVSQS